MNFTTLSNEEYLQAKSRVIESIDNYTALVKQGDAEETFIIDESVIWDRAEEALEEGDYEEATRVLEELLETLIEMEKVNDDEKLNDLEEYKKVSRGYVTSIMYRVVQAM